jgi:transposase-like protein
MLTQEQVVEARVLARRGGKVKQIARELGVSRNTVRRYLRDPQAGRYKQRAARPRKLDPFREYLHSRIEAPQPRWIPATVLVRELLRARRDVAHPDVVVAHERDAGAVGRQLRVEPRAAAADARNALGRGAAQQPNDDTCGAPSCGIFVGSRSWCAV